MSEQEIEKAIQDKGLNAPRLTPERIDKVIESAEYYVFGGVLTVCCLTLQAGFLFWASGIAICKLDSGSVVNRDGFWIGYHHSR